GDRGEAAGRSAEDADRIHAEVLVRRARQVEELRGESQPPLLTKTERLEQAQVEVKEPRLAQAVATYHMPIDDRAVVIRVAVVLNVVADHSGVGEAGASDE